MPDEFLALARAIASRYRCHEIDRDELVQEATLAVISGIRRHARARTGSLDDYLASCVHHRLRRLRRREAARGTLAVPLTEDDAADLLDPATGPAERIAREDFWKFAAAALSPQQHQVLLMTAANHSTVEIAKALGCDQATVRSARRAAVVRLRALTG